MKIQEFKDGIAQIQAALQGEFPDPFLAFIWARFQNVEAATWRLTTELLCRCEKQCRQIVAADFYRCLTSARNEEDRRLKPKGNDRINEPVSFEKLMKMWAESSNPMLQDIAKEKTKRKGAP